MHSRSQMMKQNYEAYSVGDHMVTTKGRELASESLGKRIKLEKGTRPWNIQERDQIGGGHQHRPGNRQKRD